MSLIPTLDQLRIQGDKVNADLRDVLTKATWESSIDGATSITLQIRDHDKRFINEVLLNEQSIITTDDGRAYELAAISRDGSPVTTRWDDVIARALQDEEGHKPAATGTLTRSQFVRLLAEEAGVPVEAPDGDPLGGPIGRGVAPDQLRPGQTQENSWDGGKRLSREVAWRSFSTGEQWMFAPDDHLFSRVAPIPIRENTAGIGTMKWKMDMGQPVDTMTFDVRARRWAVLAGHPVTVLDQGPASGDWLVANIKGGMQTTAGTVRLTRPQEPLPEPVHEVVTGPSTLPIPGQPGTAGVGGGRVTPDYVAVALGQSGKRYIYGAEASPSNASPSAFDCSELVEWALARVGVRFVDGSANQAIHCRNAGRLISIADGVRTYGALLFRTPGFTPGHVAISLGNGSTIEARGRRYGVGSWSATSGRAWTHAGLVPGISY